MDKDHIPSWLAFLRSLFVSKAVQWKGMFCVANCLNLMKSGLQNIKQPIAVSHSAPNGKLERNAGSNDVGVFNILSSQMYVYTNTNITPWNCHNEMEHFAKFAHRASGCPVPLMQLISTQ